MVEGAEYEVYIGRVGKEIVYIGSGKRGRHKHLNSGRSSVYEANKLHMEGGYIFVQVIPMTSKKEATELEINLIKEKAPLWNKAHNPRPYPTNPFPSDDMQNFYSVKDDGIRPPFVYRSLQGQEFW